MSARTMPSRSPSPTANCWRRRRGFYRRPPSKTCRRADWPACDRRDRREGWKDRGPRRTPFRIVRMSIRSRLLLLVLLTTLIPLVLVGLRYLVDREKDIATAVDKLAVAASDTGAALNE